MARKRRRLTKARRELAARYWPLARALARPWAELFPGAADALFSAAALGLCLGAADYRRRLGPPGTYLRARVCWSLVDARRELAIDALRTPADLVEAEEPIDPTPGPPDQLEARELLGLVGRLPPREAEAVRRIVVEGRSQAEAAPLLGCSPARAHGLKAAGLARLRERLTR